MLTIGLEDVMFIGRHGFFAEEMEVPHEFMVTVYVTIKDPSVPISLDDTIDYADIYAEIAGVLETPQALLEQMAEGCVAHLLKEFEKIESVDFKITKIRPPVISMTGHTSVRLIRSRNASHTQ